MVSKALIASAYHAKLETLGAHSDLELMVVAPEYWAENGRRQAAEPVVPKSYRLTYQRLRLNGRFHLHWWPDLADVVDSFAPDVLHIDEEPYNLAAAHACRVGHSSGTRVVFFAWQNLRRLYPPPFRWFERYVFGRAAGIAGTTTAADVLEYKGFRGSLAVIPQFGVDEAMFSPCGSSPGRNKFTIGYAGRLVAEKGIELLVDGVEALGDDTVLQIAGGGPLELVLRKRLADTSHTRLLGPLPSTHMPRFYRGLDVLVLPTRGRRGWTEQFGRAAIEAMACGVPVIVSDAGELPSVVGGAGCVVPAGDGEALVSELRALRYDQEHRDHLARTGRARVLAMYTNRRIANATARFYRQLLANPGTL